MRINLDLTLEESVLLLTAIRERLLVLSLSTHRKDSMGLLSRDASETLEQVLHRLKDEAKTAWMEQRNETD